MNFHITRKDGKIQIYSGDYICYSIKTGSKEQRSYYDRTKGKGKKELDAYIKARKEWIDREMAELPPRHFPGLSASFEELGYADKVMKFYSGTRYWGD